MFFLCLLDWEFKKVWGCIYLGHKNAIEIFTVLDECIEPSIGIFVFWVFNRFLLSSDGNWAFFESFYVYNSFHTVVLFLIPCILYLATYEWPSHDGKTFILPFKIRARWDKDFLMVQCYLFSPFCAVLVLSWCHKNKGFSHNKS